MKLIVGLGNPGLQYETTRHNVGFLLIDRLIDRWRTTGPSIQYQAETWKGALDAEKLLLIKPQTYMNRSGISVGSFVSFFKAKPADLIVIHDDLDLPAMSLRIKTGGGDGGHNGLKSIDQHLSSVGNGYHRIRIGIGRPLPLAPGAPTRDIADYVLESYSQPELDLLDPILDQASTAVELCLRGQVKEAMNRFNRKSSAHPEES